MRRLAFVIALLAGFAGDGYASSARLRRPVPIERRIDVAAGAGLVRTLRWWLG